MAKKVIRIPTYMRPRPWKHLLCWLLRTSVPTYDYCSMSSAVDANERAQMYERLYYEECAKREALAVEHQPHLISGSKDFRCASSSCVHMWPCPTYKWATDQPNLEPLRLTKKSK